MGGLLESARRVEAPSKLVGERFIVDKAVCAGRADGLFVELLRVERAALQTGDFRPYQDRAIVKVLRAALGPGVKPSVMGNDGVQELCRLRGRCGFTARGAGKRTVEVIFGKLEHGHGPDERLCLRAGLARRFAVSSENPRLKFANQIDTFRRRRLSRSRSETALDLRLRELFIIEATEPMRQSAQRSDERERRRQQKNSEVGIHSGGSDRGVDGAFHPQTYVERDVGDPGSCRRCACLEMRSFHAMAAGVTMRKGALAQLRAFLETALSADVEVSRRANGLLVDGAVTAASVNTDLVGMIGRAGPFGSGNPEPVIALPAHTLTYAEEVGQAHMRVRLKSADGAAVNAIAFRAVGQKLGAALRNSRGLRVHAAGTLALDHWQGEERVQFKLTDIAPAEPFAGR